MTRFHLIPSLCWLAFVFPSCGEGSVSLRPLSIFVETETPAPNHSFHRVYMNAGANKFAFLIPDGYRISGDPALGKLILVNDRIGTSLNVHILTPGSAVQQETNHAALEQHFPNAKVVEEFVRPVLGRECKVYDLAGKSAAGIIQKIRTISVPTPAGLLEVTFASNAENFFKSKTSLDQLLGSLVIDVNGKLVVHHIMTSF